MKEKGHSIAVLVDRGTHNLVEPSEELDLWLCNSFFFLQRNISASQYIVFLGTKAKHVPRALKFFWIIRRRGDISFFVFVSSL
jgi:hypothetical protein